LREGKRILVQRRKQSPPETHDEFDLCIDRLSRAKRVTQRGFVGAEKTMEQRRRYRKAIRNTVLWAVLIVGAILLIILLLWWI